MGVSFRYFCWMWLRGLSVGSASFSMDLTLDLGGSEVSVGTAVKDSSTEAREFLGGSEKIEGRAEVW
jgi:hypothetical protein